MKKLIVIFTAMLFVLGMVVFPCLAEEKAAAEKAAPAKVAPMKGKGPGPKMAAKKAPIVKLERIDINNYWGYYLDPKEKRGAVLNLAFVFSIENPNNFKVMLDDLKFTVAFEDFELNTITYFDDNYIPPKTTEYMRIVGAFDAYTAMLSLLVTSGHRLQEMNVKAPDLLKKWWEGIADFNFPIQVKEGSATFVYPDGKSETIAFEGTFPPKK